MAFDMNYSMTIGNWDKVKNFTPEEFGAVNMSGVLVFTIQDMRDYVNRYSKGEKRIFVNRGYEQGSSGYHPLYQAADLVIEDMHPVDMYLVAERFDAFNGIGIYPSHLHVDTRPKKKTNFDSRWLSIEKTVKGWDYLPLNAKNLNLLNNLVL